MNFEDWEDLDPIDQMLTALYEALGEEEFLRIFEECTYETENEE